MKTYLLDTSALLCLRDDEPGAERVAEILALAQSGQAQCVGCFITLMELMYRVWRDETKADARLAYEQCLALPIVWIHETPELLIAAAEIKAQYPLSVADAWIAAAAQQARAVLVHKDPEFAQVALAQELLPLKAVRRRKP
ncbi:PIN domain-containing protein [Polaromonas sp.]|jgi:ribonuclease VapC|uniref:PIN domain-containing protein n=1 Tax=Polaromonas sp. TaxID=1869339 RepID=UPI0035625235